MADEKSVTSLPVVRESHLREEATFPHEEVHRAKSRGGNLELPAPHFDQQPYLGDSGERLEMEKTDIPTKSGDFKFSSPKPSGV